MAKTAFKRVEDFLLEEEIQLGNTGVTLELKKED